MSDFILSYDVDDAWHVIVIKNQKNRTQKYTEKTEIFCHLQDNIETEQMSGSFIIWWVFDYEKKTKRFVLFISGII